MAFCKNCGNQLEDGAQFCGKCGMSQAAATEPAPQAAPASTPKLSDWDGSVLDTFIHTLVASLLISVTCGIATPWAICYLWNFIVSHALVDGKRLRFEGTGAGLFGNWIKWFILTVITCGIYSFWVAPRLYKWVVTNTHFE